MLTAEEAWMQATTPQQRSDMYRGLPVEVTLTHEQFEAIENDPLRVALREWRDKLERLLDATILTGEEPKPVPATFRRN